MVDIVLAILVVVSFLSILLFADNQLTHRRKKRQERWKIEHEAKEKRVEEVFAEPDDADEPADESGESDDSDSDDLPRVRVEAEPVAPVDGLGNESCDLCGRSDSSNKMVRIAGEFTVCQRQSCMAEAERKYRREVLLE